MIVLNKEDKAAIRKIIMALPSSPEDSSNARYLRASKKFAFHRKRALEKACKAAANGVEEYRILALRAISEESLDGRQSFLLINK